jgi:hypothetical protein
MQVKELKNRLKELFIEYSHIRQQAESYEKQVQYFAKCHSMLMDKANEYKDEEKEIINKLEQELSKIKGSPVKLEVSDLVKIIKDDEHE